MVVAPPSVHPSGRLYRWLKNLNPSAQALASMPEWLVSLVVGAREDPAHRLAHWRSVVKSGVEEGARNNSLASLAGYLLWHGLDPEVVLEVLLCWNRVRCRPPLSDGEVAAVVTSIARLHSGHMG